MGAGDCRLLLHLVRDTSLHALRLVNKHSIRGAGALTEPRYLLRSRYYGALIRPWGSHRPRLMPMRRAAGAMPLFERPLWRLFFGAHDLLELEKLLDWGHRSTKSSLGRIKMLKECCRWRGSNWHDNPEMALDAHHGRVYLLSPLLHRGMLIQITLRPGLGL